MSRHEGLVPALLVDLVDNPLDPGYATAARRRGTTPVPAGTRRAGTAAVAGACLLIGLLLVVAYHQTHLGAPAAKRAHDRLVTRVHDAQHQANELAGQATALDASLAAAQARALPASGTRQLAADQLAAGLFAVKGPGITVTLSEPKAATHTQTAGRGGSVPIGSTTTLTDRDVRSVVNELWHDGAEAIAVNGVRLTPTSAIRFAGEAVLVDFQPIAPPYRVEAIGNSDALSVAFAQSAVASRYQTLVGALGIGFDVDESGSLTLPAGTAVTLTYARAAR